MVIGMVGGSLGILIVALAPDIAVVLVGWCIAQLFFNALLAAAVAVLPDQVPAVRRGLVAGVLGVRSRRPLRHHRSRRHPAREACPVSPTSTKPGSARAVGF